MGFRELRRDHPIEEFDYQLLLNYLSDYQNQRSKITRLMRDEKIIRVKKGLYVFGPDYRKGLVCKESLANLIYGPSYISYEYALSFHGLIPERVETITSTSLGRSRSFDTPLGSFTYRQVPKEQFQLGFTAHKFDEYHTVMIASPEKALLDQVAIAKGLTKNMSIGEYLYHDLRIDESELHNLNLTTMKTLSHLYSQPRVQRLVQFVEEVQHGE